MDLTLRVLMAFAALGLVASTAAAGERQASGFRYGVAAGEVLGGSVVLWTRAPAPGPVEVEVRGMSGRLVTRRTLDARAANDLIVQTRVVSLRLGKRFRYRFRQGSRVSLTGAFETAPPPGADARICFAVSGDADATLAGNGKPAYNRFQVYGRMAAEQNDFNVNLGDTIYSDSGVGAAKAAVTVAEKWEKYKLGLSLPALRRLRSEAALYSHWDDHEFVNDFSRPENGAALYEAGVKAFRDYSPVTYSSARGIYRSARWGKNLELFFLDERSFRSAKVREECDGDLAPTAPPAVRAALVALVPALAASVSAKCLAAIEDPGRTMLGGRQYAAFTKAIARSEATWKVVVNEVPIQQYFTRPYDRWEGYAAERERLLRFLQRHVRNVVFLATDQHASLIGQIRYDTLGGRVESSGMWEVVTGPVATNTFSTSIENLLGTRGTGAVIGALFFKPPPPRGIGMRCVALDTFSYAQVTVTAHTLTVAPKDAQGRPVREATGAPCAPLVLRAR